jgi:hypothetical protein
MMNGFLKQEKNIGLLYIGQCPTMGRLPNFRPLLTYWSWESQIQKAPMYSGSFSYINSVVFDDQGLFHDVYPVNVIEIEKKPHSSQWRNLI